MTSLAAQHLKNISIFANLTDEERSTILKRLEITSLVKDEVLFKQGDQGDAMYIAMEGEIALTRIGNQGHEVLLQAVQPGDTFGELSLIDNSPRAATATATVNSYLFRLSQRDFFYMLTQQPTLTLDILADVAKKLRHANSDIQGYANSLDHANQQLRELNQLKSAFIGLVTQELRAPFASIDFSLQLLQRDGFRQLSPAQQSEFEALVEHVQDAQKMADNLVTTANFLSKQGQLDKSAVSVRQLFRQVITKVKPRMDSESIALSVQVPKTAVNLFADPNRLQEALFHLLDNAIRHTDPHGKIILRGKANHDYAIFEVQDNGSGIPHAKLNTIWNAFTQLAKPDAAPAEGIGLGLALVRYIAKTHGGRVWADSSPGLGSTFGFAIPLSDAKPVSS